LVTRSHAGLTSLSMNSHVLGPRYKLRDIREQENATAEDEFPKIPCIVNLHL
jgi:hypothetical protein